ncbi:MULTISPECIES: VWA domain-containing protein [Cytobacillus]|uniref:VWA domain-containing protein n=1 Tax=Cytobacillus TaxID=2675230 RepID=UPI00203C7AEC|nr:VWA domain-containing protein [Cytobacillus kochii]MCM3324861.1 VWA domain-containing protein [Cytobacillus kochii]MCM3347254.1 VWA domain-containing protein [Cytobacillus kochii]MDM5205968.1 VWA domain-containing protein [Cytobacillus kochii]
MKKTVYICLLLLFSVMVVACSSDEGKSNDTPQQTQNQKEQTDAETQETLQKASEENEIAEEAINEELVAKELPKNIEEIIEYPIGILGSEDTMFGDRNVEAVLNDIPALPEDANDEELQKLTNYLYSVFKMPYEDPKVSIEESSLNKPEEAEELASKEQYNVEIVLDASGSMANYMGSKTRMDLAKESIEEFASTLPEDVNLSLRVYGHEGSGSDEDKKMSCAANELVYESKTYNESELSNALDSFDPAGWTPLAQSIKEAKEDLSKYSGEEHKNVVYIVSDGIETCDGDPVAAAKELKDSGISPVVNVIGFDLASKDEQQLKEIAKAADGSYVNVNNQNQLNDELGKTVNDTLKWIGWKNSETLSAISTKNKEILEIISVNNKWKNKLRKEKNLTKQSVYSLKNDDKISDDQSQKIVSKVEEFYKKHNESIEELKTVLMDLSKENLKETLDEIDKLYEKNVSN